MTGIPRTPPRRLMRLVSQMPGHLHRQGGLHRLLDHAGRHSGLTGQLQTSALACSRIAATCSSITSLVLSTIMAMVFLLSVTTTHTPSDTPPTVSANASTRCSPTNATAEVEQAWTVYQKWSPRIVTRPGHRQATAQDLDRHRWPWPARVAGRDPYAGPDPQASSRWPAGLFRPSPTSNGPTEAINGRLERIRGSALGFRNFRHPHAHGHRPQTLPVKPPPQHFRDLDHTDPPESHSP